jgi:hypothetical protein
VAPALEACEHLVDLSGRGAHRGPAEAEAEARTEAVEPCGRGTSQAPQPRPDDASGARPRKSCRRSTCRPAAPRSRQESSSTPGGRSPTDPCAGAHRPRRRGGGGSDGETRGRAGRGEGEGDDERR